MAKRKKRATVRRGKSAAHGKARKSSKSARGKKTKRNLAKPTTKTLTSSKAKRAATKKIPRRKVLPIKPSNTPEVETVIVNAVEEPFPGVISVTEVEEAGVREQVVTPERHLNRKRA